MDKKFYFTGVNKELKKKILFQGSIWAAIGTLPLIAFGIFSSVKLLSILGLPLLVFWLICLLIGMIPFRKLTRLESIPDSLILDPEKLVYSRGKNEVLGIPLESISDIQYVEKPRTYGIGVILKNPVPIQVVIYGEKKSLQRLYGKEGYDLFFPYFTETTCTDLKEHVLDV